MASEDPVSVKLVIVGDGCVGKTCVLISYTTDRFPTDYVPTVFDNYAATIKVDNRLINLGLWDTAGQEQYNRLRPLAYPHCDVFLITFSVVDPASFVHARDKWFPELEANVPNVPKIFVGNKIDLRAAERAKKKNPKQAPIEKATAQKIIEEEFKSRYFECSALTQEGLKEIFEEAIRMVIANKTGKGKMAAKSKEKGDEGKCNFCSFM